MSTLEKTIGLLETMPDDKIETIYAFVRFINSDAYKISSEIASIKAEDEHRVSESIGKGQVESNIPNKSKV